WTLRITARAESVDGEGTDDGRKLDDADVRSPGNAVTTLLSACSRGVKREDSAVVTIHTADRETRFRVLKFFTLTFINTLQAIELAPRDFPRAEVTLQCVDDFGKRYDRIAFSISYTRVPQTEERHRHGFRRAAMIPAHKFLVDLA